MPDEYDLLRKVLDRDSPDGGKRVTELVTKLGMSLSGNEYPPEAVGKLIQRACRATALRRLITDRPEEVCKIALNAAAEHLKELS